MKTTILLHLLCHIFFAFSNGYGGEPVEVEHPVVKVLTIKAPDKIGAVFWNVQRSLCTIQISFPSLPDEQKQPEHSRTQVWLLKTDGTLIPQSIKPHTSGISMANHTTDSITYVFPANAKMEARAVVISIGDDFFVEPLSPSAK